MDITFAELKDATRGSEDSVAIVLTGDTPFSPPLRRIWVGTTGNVKVDTPTHTGVVYTGVPSGTYIYPRATKVYATANGTSASNLVGEY